MSKSNKIKFVTLENEQGTKVCKQHAIMETESGGNKMVCSKMIASDDGETPTSFDAIEEENMNLDKLCKRCAKILSLPII
jgi:hypothetical protein